MRRSPPGRKLLGLYEPYALGSVVAALERAAGNSAGGAEKGAGLRLVEPLSWENMARRSAELFHSSLA